MSNLYAERPLDSRTLPRSSNTSSNPSPLRTSVPLADSAGHPHLHRPSLLGINATAADHSQQSDNKERRKADRVMPARASPRLLAEPTTMPRPKAYTPIPYMPTPVPPNPSSHLSSSSRAESIPRPSDPSPLPPAPMPTTSPVSPHSHTHTGPPMPRPQRHTESAQTPLPIPAPPNPNPNQPQRSRCRVPPHTLPHPLPTLTPRSIRAGPRCLAQWHTAGPSRPRTPRPRPRRSPRIRTRFRRRRAGPRSQCPPPAPSLSTAPYTSRPCPRDTSRRARAACRLRQHTARGRRKRAGEATTPVARASATCSQRRGR
ncbi:hypothetical protein C8J57DRAFT_362582 [Mycena rebaudengoi]|nr:hypothetical protein C8J57DRAFT_362582 [Mycena rebaudengoi]